MKKTLSSPAFLLPGVVVLTALVLVWMAKPAGAGAAAAQPPKERPHGIPQRVPWTGSKITGSPEPPLPYKNEAAFPKLSFISPVAIRFNADLDRVFVAEQGGKIYSFPNRQDVAKADLFVDVPRDIKAGGLYGFTIHPDFAKNRYCYLFCKGGGLGGGLRLARYTATNTNPPRVDPKTEKLLLAWNAGWHDGGDVHFGPDGYLYFTTGDGHAPNPPDGRQVGQDLSSVHCKIMRVDVSKDEPGKPYAIPPDNPYVNFPKARPEVWAYGLRNPWRMSFDKLTGDLWVGDVGWELWENVYKVKKGGNYGWSIMEGRQPVRLEGKRGPTPILPPTLDWPHSEASSIVGGYVYRGKRLPELYGAYICGDWVTCKQWATKFDGDKMLWHKEISHGTQRIVGYGEDKDGEIYFVDHSPQGRIYRLVPNPAAAQKLGDFPRKLSQTGLFSSVTAQTPAPGVVPFSVNAEQWADHAFAEGRWLALPGTSKARVYDTAVRIANQFFTHEVFFPKDGVLAKTITMEMERGNPKSRRRLETQILHFDGQDWQGLTYAWNDEQTDADLVPARGMDKPIAVIDHSAPGGKRVQKWHFHSRTECTTCHNPWVGYTLAFTMPQLQREHDYGGVSDNQVRAMAHAELIELLPYPASDRAIKTLPVLTNPYDGKADLNARARSYLHVNCAHCHRLGAGGTADLDLRFTVALESTKALKVRPLQGTFDIPGAHLLNPGEPFQSVMLYRMSKMGPGRMPHMGSELVDDRGVRLMHDWIRGMTDRREVRLMVEKLASLDDAPAQAQADALWDTNVKRQAQSIARSKGRSAPNDEDRASAATQLASSNAAAAKVRADQQDALIGKLLGTTSNAMFLAQAMADDWLPLSVRAKVLAKTTASADVIIRDLFERFLAEDQRVKRLGSIVRPEQILSLKGSVERGRELFFKSTTLQCAQCHKVSGVGSTVGPDLSEIGKTSTPPQILESLLEPSKQIDPKFVTYLVETIDGKLITGLLVEKNTREVVLKQQADKEVRIPANNVDRMLPQSKSLMPELLLRDLTAEQAADLVAFLVSLK